MQAASIDIVLDQHAGTLRASAATDELARAGFDLLPATEELLRQASELQIPVRIVVAEGHDGDPVHELEALVSEAEIVAGIDGLEPRDRPGILVAADRVVRARAAGLGWTAVPHPALASAVARGETLVFAWLSGELAAIGEIDGLVPYWLEDHAGSSRALAALPRSAVAHAIDKGIGVHRLPLDLALEDPLFVQLDEGAQIGDTLAGYEILWSDPTRLLLALDAQSSNDEVPAHGAHGHFLFLTPNPELLRPATVLGLTAATSGAAGLQVAAAPAPVTAESYLADIARYAGLAPLDARGALRSRHSSHPDNARAVAALVAELREMGYAPFTHEFSFGGRVLRNVLADFPGSGELGVDAGVLVVGCHMDSTAARDPGYQPASSPARGADDDGSGMAALLAIARWLRSGEPLHHTVRFGFFNAEESGLVGSRAYAASLKAAGAPVLAAVCADMIGYNSDERQSWEVHAGYTNARIRDLSVPFAQAVADAGAQLGDLPATQIVSGTIPRDGDDPTRFDGAINRSDHASFQEQGYPGVLVSEDFFPNRPSEPPFDPNPNYHSNSDIEIDGEYAAAITRAMSVAIAELAARPGVLPI